MYQEGERPLVNTAEDAPNEGGKEELDVAAGMPQGLWMRAT